MRPAGFGLSESGSVLRRLSFCLIAGWLALAVGVDAAGAHTLRLTRAQIIVAASPSPPADAAPWQVQTLPDNWNVSRPGIGGEAWYRVEFELSGAPLELSALYIPRLSMSGEALINGERIGGATQFSEPLTRQWYLPQLYSVPARLLKPGVNVIHVRLFAYPNNKGGLSEVYFGPASAVNDQWHARYFWGVTSVQITSAITLCLGALALLAWSLRRWNTAYGYFGAAAVLWAARNLHFFANEVPLSAVLWEVLVATSLVWVLALIFMFVLRFAGQRLAVAERLLWAFALAAPFLIWAAGALKLTFAIGICYLALLAMGAYILKVLFDVMRRERTIDAALLFGASIVVYGLGVHDWITQRDVLGFSEPYNLHFGAPILFTVVAWNMFKRFTRAQAEADDLNRSLEARVQQKSDELAHTYEHMRTVEAARMLVLERERIMRDMHDGVGSQLITAHQLAQRGALKPDELTAVLSDCIDDLRLVIDSLEPVDGDLLTLLANLRYRITDRLLRQGITLKWEVGELPPVNHLAPHDTLQILRIVQEAFTNVVKHAGASEVVFSIAASGDQRQLRLTVRDNGRGLTPGTANGSGRGLTNMKQRAQSVGGALYFDSGARGTSVIVTLPLPAAPAR